MSAQPRLRVIAGPNGSGKTTLLTKLRKSLSDNAIGVYVNADDIEASLRRDGELALHAYFPHHDNDALIAHFRTTLHNSTLLRKVGQSAIAEQLTIMNGTLQLPDVQIDSYVAAAVADAIRRRLLALRVTFTFETVMSSRDKVDFMAEAQASGYRTYLYFVATDDPSLNIHRVAMRVSRGGHPVPSDKIIARFHRSIELMNPACAVANRSYLFDNSSDEHEWIAEITDGTDLRIERTELPIWLTNSSLWASFSQDSHAEPS